MYSIKYLKANNSDLKYFNKQDSVILNRSIREFKCFRKSMTNFVILYLFRSTGKLNIAKSIELLFSKIVNLDSVEG